MRTHVLLDLDGTLSDSEPGILNSLQWACMVEGFPIPTEDEVRSVIGPPFEIGLPSIGIPDDALERAAVGEREDGEGDVLSADGVHLSVSGGGVGRGVRSSGQGS